VKKSFLKAAQVLASSTMAHAPKNSHEDRKELLH
jgi:hypothetical protein